MYLLICLLAPNVAPDLRLRGVLQLPSLAVEWYPPTLSASSRSIVIGVSEFPRGTRTGKRKWEIVS
jgi:hypothetical protein